MAFITTNWEGRKIAHCANVSEKDKRCIITIPVYKEKPNTIELASLKQCVTILGEKYEILIFCPDGIDLSKYKEESKYDFSVLYCDKRYFKSQKTYSDLCETWQFYDLLSDYEYMLIYQLDAWVFEDKLDYFEDMNYDYIGAIHLIGYRGGTGENGNGGFCLRKTKKFRDVCKKTDFNKIPAGQLEDCAFTQRLKSNFNLAPLDVCRKFSIQEKADIQFKKNGNKLPMGCHGFKKFGWRFWQNYIKIEGVPDAVPKGLDIASAMGYATYTLPKRNIAVNKVVRKLR